MPTTTKSDKIDKKTIPATPKKVKSDWLSPSQFAHKHGYPIDTTNEISQELFRKGLVLRNRTHTPMVVQNRRSHRYINGKPPLLVNPDATEIIIDKIKARMAR